MKTNYILIDYENVQPKSLALLGDESFRVYVFVGKTNTKIGFELVEAIHELGKRGKYVKLNSSGKNALDFHIAYYLGKLISADYEGSFHVISKDTGFDALIDHLKSEGHDASRSVSIETMPCFAGSTRAVTKPKLSEAKLPAAKKAKAAKKPIDAQLEERVQLVLNNLIARKNARPKKMATLLNTFRTTVGASWSGEQLEAVFNEMQRRGDIVVTGEKVEYNLKASK